MIAISSYFSLVICFCKWYQLNLINIYSDHIRQLPLFIGSMYGKHNKSFLYQPDYPLNIKCDHIKWLPLNIGSLYVLCMLNTILASFINLTTLLLGINWVSCQRMQYELKLMIRYSNQHQFEELLKLKSVYVCSKVTKTMKRPILFLSSKNVCQRQPTSKKIHFSFR
jgi:hypothetical protein